jgi:hypothetical protein
MKSLFNLLFCILLCVSCSKEETNEYEPYLKGSIIGYAMLFDQYANMLDDHSGITVYTEPGRKYAGKTDITGRFEIKGVPTGTYNLSFEKEAYNTMKYPEVIHLGGKPTIITPWDRVVLYPDITLHITTMTFQENRINVEIEYLVNPLPDFIYIRLFFSTSDGFSTEDAEYTADIDVFPSGYFQDLPDLPFESGTTVYCKGSLFTNYPWAIRFGESHYADCIDTYYDETLGATVYPNITEESDQYAFIMP